MQFEILALIHCEHEVPLSHQFLAEMLQKHGCLQFSGCVRNYAFLLF